MRFLKIVTDEISNQLKISLSTMTIELYKENDNSRIVSDFKLLQ